MYRHINNIKQEMLELMKKTNTLTNEFDKSLANSVLEVSISVNKKVVEELLVRNYGLTAEEARGYL